MEDYNEKNSPKKYLVQLEKDGKFMELTEKQLFTFHEDFPITNLIPSPIIDQELSMPKNSKKKKKVGKSPYTLNYKDYIKLKQQAK